MILQTNFLFHEMWNISKTAKDAILKVSLADGE